jgi:glucose/arabinose dehydrogenase
MGCPAVTRLRTIVTGSRANHPMVSRPNTSRREGQSRASFGRNYDGPRVSASPVADDVEQPLILWLPSIAPGGLGFYTGERFPAWKGNLFVGSARRGQIPRTGGLERVVLNDKLEELRRETLLTELRQRIRDVRQGPDGLLYVLTDEDDGALLRISPTSQVPGR